MTPAGRLNKATPKVGSNLSWLWLASLAFLTSTWAGCSYQRPLTSNPPVSAKVSDKELAKTLLDNLSNKAQILSSLQSEALMAYSQNGKRFKAREEITLRRPDRLRIEAYYALGVGLIVVSNGKEAQVFEPSKNLLLVGKPNADTLDRFVHVRLEPYEAVDLLMGLPPRQDLSWAKPSYIRREGSLMMVGLPSYDSSSLELGFTDSKLLLIRSREVDGKLRYQVNYDDYRDVGGILIAHRITAQFPKTGTLVEFYYKQAVVNRVFPESTFALSVSPATNKVMLERDIENLAS